MEGQSLGSGDRMGLVCTMVHHLPAVCHWPGHLTHLQRRRGVTVSQGQMGRAHVARGVTG